MIKNDIKLIGRTRINIDNYDIVLSEELKKTVEKLAKDFLIQNKISVLPVDVVTVARQNNWVVIPYSQLNETISQIYEEIIYTDWGFTIYYNNQYMILYDDTIKIGAQRFTIAHEIGHIILNHFVCNDMPTREIEANLFAAQILMPLNVLTKCNISTIEELQSICGVTYSAAKYRYNKYISRIILKDVKNKRINKQFQSFIDEYNKSKEQVININKSIL